MDTIDNYAQVGDTLLFTPSKESWIVTDINNGKIFIRGIANHTHTKDVLRFTDAIRLFHHKQFINLTKPTHERIQLWQQMK